MTTAPSSAPAPADWALVGRAEELAAATRALATGEPAVVLHGDAGVGKSRLARELLAQARARGDHTLWLQGTRSASELPLGAYAGLLTTIEDAQDLLPVVQRCTQAIRTGADGRPTVIAVDDAHHLDPISATLTLELAMSGAAQMIATLRAGAVVPDAITTLWKDAGAARFDIGTLAPAAAVALAELIAGGPIDEATRQWALAASGGNALYLRELVRGALQSDALQLDHGVWRMRSRPPVTATLSELVTARLVGLSDPERAALELLAVGEPLTLEELVTAASDSALETLERRGLIAIDADESVRLSHPLYAEVTADGLGTIASRRIRRQLTELVGARPTLAPTDALRVAGWAAAIGAPIDDRVLLPAANAANLAGDPTLAARLASEATGRGLGLEAVLAEARAHLLLGDHQAAEEAFGLVDETTLDDPELIVRYAQLRMHVLAWGLGRAAEAQALVDRLVKQAGNESIRQAVAPLRLLSVDGATHGETADAIRDTLSTIDVPAPLRRQLEPSSALQLLAAGRGREAWAITRQIPISLPLTGNGDEIALAAWVLVGGQASDDRTVPERKMRDVFDRAIRLRDSGAAGMAASSIAMHALAAGRLDDAARAGAEAAAHLERRDVFNSYAAILANQASTAAIGGDFVAASEFLERCQAHLAALAGPSVAPSYLVSAEARVALAGGDTVRARSLLLEGAERFTEPAPLQACSMLHEAFMAGEPASRVRPRLPALADSPLADAQRAHLTAAATSDGAGLVTASEAFEAMGMLRHAVSAAVDAADVFIAAGREDSARRAATRAHELFARGQGGIAPIIDGLDATRIGLTAREQSIVDLVRQGLSNAQIAERLVLSVRTVESHVYRASQKLGVNDRRDL